MKALIKLLPQKLSDAIYRRLLPLENYRERSGGIEVRLAKTQEELETAYRLLHDVYVAKGLMDPHPSGMRVNLYSALPYTSVLIAEFEGKIVGTVSLIKDSPLGLPSDKEYRAENTAYRRKGVRLLEVSALAVHPDFRKNSQGSLVSLLMMNYLSRYSNLNMGADALVAVVHPSTRDFYRALFGFEQNGKIIEYKFVKKALVIHLTANFTEQVEPALAKSQQLNDFFNDELKGVFSVPPSSQGILLNPVMTADLLKNIFYEKTGLFQELSRKELEYIKSAYELHFPLENMELFRFVEGRRYGFRYQSKIQAQVISDRRLMMGKIFDVSPMGAFLKTSDELNPGDEMSLIFSLGGKNIKLKAQVVRINPSQQDYYPQGVGIRFIDSSQILLEAIRGTHQFAAEKKTA